MQSYYIYYPLIYPSFASQRLISNNLIEKDIDCSKECGGEYKVRFKVYTAEVVFLRLVSHPKEESATDAQEGVHGTTSGGCTSKVSDHEAGMEA